MKMGTRPPPTGNEKVLQFLRTLGLRKMKMGTRAPPTENGKVQQFLRALEPLPREEYSP